MVTTKKKKPTFNVPTLGFFKSVKARWRRPRGTHNKKRMKFQWCGALPKVGYRNNLSIRGMHPTGKKEVLVHNLSELEVLKGTSCVVRFSSTIGAKKIKIMDEIAKKHNLFVVNSKNKVANKFAAKDAVNMNGAKL